MEVMFIDAKFTGDIGLDESTLKLCRKYKNIALYASVQFLNLDEVLRQLKDSGIEVITSKPSRADKEYQILGCDIYPENLNLKKPVDAFLYIGDGEFHPSALALASGKDIIAFNPFSNKHRIISQKDVESLRKKQRANMIKFLSSDVIGIIITSKPGQQQLRYAKQLEKKYPDKHFYYFIDNNINISSLEDFPFIQAWINTACPRLGFEFKGVNIRDVLKDG